MSKETKWSIVFAVVTVIAVIGEVITNGISAATIFSAIKDISGTAIVFAMLIVFVKSTKKAKTTFEEKMTNALNKWIDSHSNMIVKTSKMPQGHENDFGMSMTTDMNRFYNSDKLLSDGGGGVGRFLRLTEIKKDLYMQNNISMTFFFNSQTYCNSTDEQQYVEELKEIAKNISSYVKNVVSGITISEPSKIDKKTVAITIRFKNSIISSEMEDIDKIITTIDRMYEAMLVSARRK